MRRDLIRYRLRLSQVAPELTGLSPSAVSLGQYVELAGAVALSVVRRSLCRCPTRPSPAVTCRTATGASDAAIAKWHVQHRRITHRPARDLQVVVE